MKKSDLGQLIDRLDPKLKKEQPPVVELCLLESARTVAELMATIEEQQEMLTRLCDNI